MAHLIDKDVVLAEIEKTYNFHEKRRYKNDASICDVLYGLLYRIKTIEVKEVDLDTAFGVCWGEYCDCGGNINDYKIAKHFFELGMRNTITEEDCKLIWNIGDEIPNMPEEEFFKELLKQYKAQKGE